MRAQLNTSRSGSRYTAAVTTRSRAFAALASLAGLLAACDSGFYYVQQPGYDGPVVAQDGRLAVSWTLDGTPLTAERCTAERIDSFKVTVLSLEDSVSSIEFDNVACALDRYSLAMTPRGNVRVFADAIRKDTKGAECVRYTSRASATATTQFPSMATPLPLKLANECK